MPLVLGAAYVTVALCSNIAGALLLDRVGRKPLLRMLIAFLNRHDEEVI
jgi:hypothetical protein